MASSETAGKMSLLGRRHAVIGGRFGKWVLRDEPKKADAISVSQYFDEDAAMPSAEIAAGKGDEQWGGTGIFQLPDFQKLSEFLNDLSSSSNLSSTL